MADQYEKEIQAVQEIAHSGSWRSILRNTRRYVEDPSLLLPNTLDENRVALIEFGRRRPEAFGRLCLLVERIRTEGTSFRDFEGERLERLNQAVEYVVSKARPSKTIEAIKRFAADTTKDVDSCFVRSEQKVLNELVAVCRYSEAEFDMLMNVRMAKRDAANHEKAVVHRQRMADRRRTFVRLVKSLNPKLTDSAKIEGIVKQKLSDAKVARDKFISDYQKSSPDVTCYQATREYWKRFDREAEVTLSLLDRAEKGLLKLNRSECAFPHITYEDKLAALQEKYSKRK